MCVEDNQPQDHDDDWQYYTGRIHEHVVQNYVKDYRPNKYQAEWHVSVHQQQRSARDL